MDRLRFGIAKTDKIVIEALMIISDIDGKSIEVYRSKGRTIRVLKYSVFINGKEDIRKRFLSERDYKNLLRLGLIAKGYNVRKIDFLKGRKIAYQVTLDKADGVELKRRKRNK